MAHLVSKELGQEDIAHSNESYSYGANTIRDGISIGTQSVTRPLVSPANIMEMPDLTVYLRVPAPVPITKINLKYKKPDKITSGFILRDLPTTQTAQDSALKKPTHLNDTSPHAGTDRPTHQSKPHSNELIDTSRPPAKKATQQPEGKGTNNPFAHQEDTILKDHSDLFNRKTNHEIELE